jgi:uncharacterized membrane-anchored protein YitT (DUF2179 family)
MVKRKLIEYGFITLGVLCLHVGFYFFLQPINLVIGGMMGVSMLLAPIINVISIGTIYLILNVSALIIGGLIFGKQFFLRTVYATLLAPLLVALFEVLDISPNLLLDHIDSNYQLFVAAIGSGALIGIGVGCVLRYNASTGGMDVYQKMVNQYLKVPFSVAVYITDGIIVLIGMALNIQTGVFAIISLVLSAVLIDKVAVAGRNSYTVLIITKKADAIKEKIFEKLDRGLTKVKAIGGYTGEEKDMIICSISRQQLYDLKEFVREIDPLAFSLILHTKEVLGEGFHRNDIV